MKEIDFEVGKAAAQNSELTAKLALASEKVINEGRTHEAETHVTLADPGEDGAFVVLVDSEYAQVAYQVDTLEELQESLAVELEAHKENYTEVDLEPAHEVTNPDLLAEFEMTVPA